MIRSLLTAFVCSTSMAAAETECFPVQISHQLCQDGSPFQPGNVMSLGLQADGWDYFQAQESFTRIISTDQFGGTMDEMHNGYLETLQGEIVSQSSHSTDTDGNVNFAVSVRGEGQAKGAPVFVTLVPSSEQVLVIETVFPNKFQLDKGAELTSERQILHQNVVQKVSVLK